MAEEKGADLTRIMAALAIFLSLGFGIVGNLPVDSPEAYQNTYVCDLDSNYGVFYGGISGTGYSAYPNADDRKGAIRCGSSDNKGVWKPLLEFILSDPVTNNEVPLSSAGDYLCSPERCLPIN